jgi:hypothetical protein
VANALELTCSLGFPNILLNIDMAALVAQTHHLQSQTKADTVIHRPIQETHQVRATVIRKPIQETHQVKVREHQKRVTSHWDYREQPRATMYFSKYHVT